MSSAMPRSLNRSYALDNLRTFLTILVILHHAALAYGGTGSFGYCSPYHPPGSSISLTAFNVLNQTFFMALFFLISGYFSSVAARKRARTVFLKEKFKRLGVPTLVYSVLGRGIMRAIIEWRKAGTGWVEVKDEFVVGVKSVRGTVGPTWYTALLLIFDAVYTLGWPTHFSLSQSRLSPTQSSHQSKGRATLVAPAAHRQLIKTSHLVAALTVTATSAFLIRTQYPFGHIFIPLNLNLGYSPQYILYYCAGIWIQRRSIPLYRTVPSHAIVSVGVIALGMIIIGAVNVREVSEGGQNFQEVVRLAGGAYNILAILYSALNEFVGFLFSTFLLYVFHRYSFLSAHWTILGVDLAKGSYAAFLVHIPVLVETMTFLNEDAWKGQGSVLKTAVVGAVAVVKSWSLGYVLKWAVEWCGWIGYL